MKRYTRKAMKPATGRRFRPKNYDDVDDFESTDFGPGDPPAVAQKPSSNSQ